MMALSPRLPRFPLPRPIPGDTFAGGEAGALNGIAGSDVLVWA